MSMVQDMAKAAQGLWSLVVGLRITGWNFLRPQVTVHYPRQAVPDKALSTYRGHIELVGKDKDPAAPRCITCMLCESLCPSGCISIQKPKPAPKAKPAEKMPEADGSAVGPVLAPEKAPPPEKKAPAAKGPVGFSLDYTTCSLCGLCVQNCPVDSLRFSTDVYLCGSRREDFHYDLMARLARQASGPQAVRAPQTGEES